MGDGERNAMLQPTMEEIMDMYATTDSQTIGLWSTWLSRMSRDARKHGVSASQLDQVRAKLPHVPALVVSRMFPRSFLVGKEE